MCYILANLRNSSHNPLFIDPHPNPVAPKILFHWSSFSQDNCINISVLSLNGSRRGLPRCPNQLWPRTLTWKLPSWWYLLSQCITLQTHRGKQKGVHNFLSLTWTPTRRHCSPFARLLSVLRIEWVVAPLMKVIYTLETWAVLFFI